MLRDTATRSPQVRPSWIPLPLLVLLVILVADISWLLGNA